MQDLLRKRAVKKLNRAVSGLGGITYNWPAIVQRFENYTVKRGSLCGRILALEIDGFYFEFRDGAHNCYSWMAHSFDEFNELLNDIKANKA